MDSQAHPAMRAVVHDEYGPPGVLRLDEVDRPVPRDDEVLVRIRATTVSRTDTGLRSAEIPISRLVTGLIRPKHRVLGMEFAGDVASVGASVTQFKPGDEVFGYRGHGAHAEYISVPESGAVALKPAGISLEEAAAVCDGVSLALPCLRTADLRNGQTILIYGASGSVGTSAVQLAKTIGAHVTAVCATGSVDLVRSLGADEVVDYTAEDFTKVETRYDVVFDAVGKTSFRRCRVLVKRGGRYVETDLGYLWHVPLLALATKWVGSKRVKLGIARFTRDDIVMLSELIEAGKYKAVIDRTYPLEEVVEATRYVETGQKIGNVVLTVDG
jgi:NADPH:quinone reductase-like Zn-dependent oxidoreductase